MNQAKQAAARSWRSTLSSDEKEDHGPPSVSEADEGKPQFLAEQRDGERAQKQDMQAVQIQSQDARYVMCRSNDVTCFPVMTVSQITPFLEDSLYDGTSVIPVALSSSSTVTPIPLYP
jgi:hypothetical protein